MCLCTGKPLQLSWILLLVASCIAVAAPTSPSKDTCLLQQHSSSQRSSIAGMLEDVAAKQSKQSPMESNEKEAKHGSKSAPRFSGKKAPVSGAKRNSKRSAIVSTPIDDIEDDDLMSQRVELHLTDSLESITKSFGSLDKFGASLRGALSAELGRGDMSEKQLAILNIGGEYLDSDGKAANGGKSHGKYASRVDFEVFPGEDGEDSPGSLLKRLAAGMSGMKDFHDKQFAEGPLAKVIGNSAMVVKQGSKVAPPSTVSEHAHHGEHHHSHSEEKEEEEEEEEEDSYFPVHSTWEWITRGHSRRTSAPWTALPLLLTAMIALRMSP